jgi:hypothetical protein
MSRLRPELADVLRRIAAADAGRDVRFRPFFTAQSDGPIKVVPQIEGCEVLQAGRIFALHDLAFREVEPPRGNNEFGVFWITAASRDAVARYRERIGVAPARAMDTSWVRLRPVLVAVVEQWEQLGARDAVETDAIVAALDDDFDATTVRRALELLEQDDTLEAEFELGSDGPIAVTPAPKALQLLRGWPTQTNDAAIVQALLLALDEAIENTLDPEEKTRLRKLRDAVGDVGKSVWLERSSPPEGRSLGGELPREALRGQPSIVLLWPDGVCRHEKPRTAVRANRT